MVRHKTIFCILLSGTQVIASLPVRLRKVGARWVTRKAGVFFAADCVHITQTYWQSQRENAPQSAFDHQAQNAYLIPADSITVTTLSLQL